MRSPKDVRGGGKATPDGYLFELTGGNLALDLANTVDNRPTERRRDLLPGYADLVAWAEQASAVGPSDAAGLRLSAEANRAGARRALREAKLLREAIFSVFSSIAENARPPEEALATLNTAVARAFARLRVEPDEHGFSWQWEESDVRLDRVVWPAVRAAAELLTSGDLARIRKCAASDCDWLFLDTSRNGSRRWCDMSICGNRSKARTFYRRRKRTRC